MLNKCENINFAGRAKHRVRLESQTVTEDVTGGRVITWNTYKNVYAIVETVSVYESINSKQLQSEVSHKITIRYDDNLANTAETAKYRLVLDGRYHSIEGIFNLGLDMKSYGKFYQKLITRDNGSEYQG